MSTGLLGPDGKPISTIRNKKATPPALGTRYGQWAGEQTPIFSLPGGGAIAFDTNQLTLSDFRQMKSHYQINSSLSVLTFMMHQMEWHIEVTDRSGQTTKAKQTQIAEHCEENLTDVWSQLIRAKSQALWAGYSPSALEWDNDIQGRALRLTKIKDLVPEDCRVKWKGETVSIPGPGNGKHTYPIYDGIRQFGSPDIPVDNSYWYPLLMENGNYYGRRILESAFQPWFFSTLMHLFANRYYERFGEPVPVGRAPYEDEITVGDGEKAQTVKGNVLMGHILQSLRNRSTVVLPNEKTTFGDETTPTYDYQIEYLESQMRGADFERYMTRLDEEMSLAMFTPILMVRTADVGSYNLGQQHTQVYQWMLNAIAGDWAQYINKYILRPMVNFNFGLNAPSAKIKFMKLGRIQTELLQAIITQVLTAGTIKPDIRELGELSGLTFEEVEAVTDTPAPAPANEKTDPNTDNQTDQVGRFISNRVRSQVKKAYRLGEFNDIGLGYKRQLTDALVADGFDTNVESRVSDFYDSMNGCAKFLCGLGVEEFADVDSWMRHFDNTLANTLKQIKR